MGLTDRCDKCGGAVPPDPAPYRCRRCGKVPGFNVRTTPRGFTVVEIDHWANPEKDEEWARRKETSMPSRVQFRREFRRDWTSAAGETYYPEFMANPVRFLRRCQGLIAGLPVIRGWDLGFRRPSCVWMQYSPKAGRLWVLRELIGHNINTHSFRDLVLYLSGELPETSLERRPRALELLNQLRSNNALPPPPWFSPDAPLQWRDYAGPEANQRHAEVEHDSAARTQAQILDESGIRLGVYYSTPKGRGEVLRRLLMTRPDGLPGLFLDPACADLARGFSGAIVFAKGSKENPNPDEPEKDGYFDNLHDALGYGAVNLVPAVEETEPPPPAMVWEGRRQVPAPAGDGFDIYELTAPIWE